MKTVVFYYKDIFIVIIIKIKLLIQTEKKFITLKTQIQQNLMNGRKMKKKALKLTKKDIM